MPRYDDESSLRSGHSTTFIGVIDASRTRVAKMKKSLVKGARVLRDTPTKSKNSSSARSVSSSLHSDEEFALEGSAGHYENVRAYSSPGGSSSRKGRSKEDSLNRKPSNSTHQTSASTIETEDDTARRESMKREARKKRAKDKIEKYKEDRKQLKHNCTALEQQLVETAEKLREVDSKAAFKIDSLESELRETRVGMEVLVNQSTKEVTDQSMCIKTLGKKLIRQAHVIKQQKKAVEGYQIQLDALREEMAMQDERDGVRDEEYNELKEDFERTLDQKLSMQTSLQESIEEMMELKKEREMAAARIKELELTLEEKEIDLERAARDNAEKTERICTLEGELEEKMKEVEEVTAQLKLSENSVEVMKMELERSTSEMDDLRGKVARMDNSRHDSLGGSRHNPRPNSFMGWKRGTQGPAGDGDATLEEKLEAKELQVQALDQNAKDNADTIATLKSDLVKMSSTFKQEDYLKRKQIAKLKQDNAEYALKLRSLEKAFKGINADTPLLSLAGSRHSKSLHGTSTSPNKEDRAQAVKSRVGGSGSSSTAPYEFPAMTTCEGEVPEEC
eukprot:scaffold331_cov191-Alexandrium_tamarense.AAC.13